MSLGKGFPSRHPWGRVSAMGSPMHGIVQGGVLTLPNATTMPYPQPTGEDLTYLLPPGRPWAAASTYYVKRPGWTMTPRAADQLAADAAAGREWRDYALLSGLNRSYCGQSLNGWIYFDDTGAAWTVRLDAIAGTVSAASMQFTFTRFGLFSGNQPVPTTRATPVFDQGQGGAAVLKYRPTQGGALVTLAPDDPADIICVSQTPDGSKSLWMRSVRHYAKSAADCSTCEDRPIAFIEVVITAGKTVTATTIRSRAQCIGVTTTDVDIFGDDRWVVMAESGSDTIIGQCANFTNITEIYIDPVYLIYEGTPLPAEYAGANSYRVPMPVDAAGGMVGQILAMWYDAGGLLHEIACNASHTYKTTSSGTGSASGQIHTIWDCDTQAFLHSGSYSITRTDNLTLSEALRVVLTDNGVEIPQSETVMQRTGSATRTDTRTRNGGAAERASTSDTTISDSVTLNGAAVSAYSTSAGALSATNPSPLSEMRFFTSGDVVHFDVLPFGMAPRAASAYSGAKSGWWVDFVRWSATAIGIRLQSQRVVTGVYDVHDFGAVVTPGGALAHSQQYLTAGDRTRVECSGSLQPVTAQLATVVTNESAAEVHNPKCWV